MVGDSRQTTYPTFGCEVLPPRRVLTPRGLLIAAWLGLAVGCCASAHLADLPDRPYTAAPHTVPLSVWRSDTMPAWFARPSLLCLVNGNYEAPVWEGTWRCPDGARQ